MKNDNITRITCISDLHGNLIDIPECGDLLLIAGDIVPLDIQRNHSKSFEWWCEVFLPWKEWIERKNTKVLITFGNHDFFGETYSWSPAEGVLIDQQVEFKGLKIYGTPYQQYFHNWAFNLHDPELAQKYDLIPEDTDILLVHNPPYGIGDWVEEVYGGEEIYKHVGSNVLTNRIHKLPNLKLVVCGHIHSAYGAHEFTDMPLVVNAAICNEDYVAANKPIIVEFK